MSDPPTGPTRLGPLDVVVGLAVLIGVVLVAIVAITAVVFAILALVHLLTM
jgi:hypothetical protein